MHLAHLSDPTFTISNLGRLGIAQFTPLVNPPKSAIPGIAAPRPVFTPGANAASFLPDLKAEMESLHINP